MAWDSARRRFLVGSLAKRKVVAVTEDGRAEDFIAGAPGLLRVVGIHVDSARNRLWFATWAPDSNSRAAASERGAVTRLFRADLRSGKVVASYVPAAGAPGHLFNDFAVAPNGDLFITDSDAGALYRLHVDRDSLELLVPGGRYSIANGIALSPDARTLYVAFLEGIARVDVETQRMELLATPDSVSTAGPIDGLYWYRGSLIAVSHVAPLERVVRYHLSPDGTRIDRVTVLERGRPMMNLPTTGVIVGSRFYYIANSQFDRLDDDGKLAPRSPPVRSVVRVIELEP